MKTKSTRTSLALACVMACVLFSSFGPGKNPGRSLAKTDWEEYNKVQEYLYKEVCQTLSKNLKRQGNATDYFSRCPSGYQAEISTNADSVSTKSMVAGSVVFYKGCKPSDVCDFKVCVASGYTVVKSKKAKDYMQLGAWIAQKKAAEQSAAREKQLVSSRKIVKS